MKTNGFESNVYLNKPLRNDDVFVSNHIDDLSEITGMPVRKGLENGIICGGILVNTVSKSYGHLPNENYFREVERKLNEEGIGYVTRSINRNNCSFAVDYILSDDRYQVTVKKGADRIRPMMRYTNSYDGSCPTAGYFGFFRQICKNGLHVCELKVGFSVKHKGNMIRIVLPEIGQMVESFMDNEFYSMRRRFEVLAERPISDLDDFVRVTAENFNLFLSESGAIQFRDRLL